MQGCEFDFFSNTSALLNAEVFLVLGVVHENCKH